MLELNQCYNMDCMKGMAQFPDGFFDLAVVDPPYFSGPERRGYYGSKVSKIGVYRDYPVSPVWEIPGRAYFDELRRVAKHYIVWGCNYPVPVQCDREVGGRKRKDGQADQPKKDRDSKRDQRHRRGGCCAGIRACAAVQG